MTSLLRQIIAGPRTRHAEADLDLCYVTSQIIATSAPSSRYPQRAYRNPLDQFVRFLDKNHGTNWAIWEFRAEGAGYLDEEVYGRVWHYPWPDHHPPPFKLVPIIMTGIKNWLQENSNEGKDGKRVVVLHCQAGKGRSGTIVCSYLISECGWNQQEALNKFTERRMRPGFGQGVSISSQLRWIEYVDRWTQCNKTYVDMQIEILELHVWGLRNGVKVQVRGFVNEGKTIKIFHTFSKKEQIVIESNKVDQRSTTHCNEDQGTSNFSLTDSKSRLKRKLLYNIDGGTGGSTVIFKPSFPIIVPTSDVNIDFERRRKFSLGWKVVTSIAHVWFNCYFEGQSPEKSGQQETNGVFEIEWDGMDGIKGSSKKGARALDRLAVKWKVHCINSNSVKEVKSRSELGPHTSVPQISSANRQESKDSVNQRPGEVELKPEVPSTDNPEANNGLEGENNVRKVDKIRITSHTCESNIKTAKPNTEAESTSKARSSNRTSENGN